MGCRACGSRLGLCGCPPSALVDPQLLLMRDDVYRAELVPVPKQSSAEYASRDLSVVVPLLGADSIARLAVYVAGGDAAVLLDRVMVPLETTDWLRVAFERVDRWLRWLTPTDRWEIIGWLRRVKDWRDAVPNA